MKILYLDLETTGLDWKWCQILEIGMVLDDLTKPLADAPTFHTYVTHEKIRGQPHALAMHQRILERIAKKESGFKYLPSDNVYLWFQDSIRTGTSRKILTAGGKNLTSFDYNFLGELNGFTRDGGKLVSDDFKLVARVVDPAMLYFNPSTDDILPSTDECLERAGIAQSTDHTAIGDCLLCAKLVRSYYEKESNLS